MLPRGVAISTHLYAYDGYTVFYLAVAIVLVFLLLGGRSRWTKEVLQPPQLENDRNISKNAQAKGEPPRPYGTWQRSTFKRPPATPYPDWSLETTKPLPYRPFKYGPHYRITMALRNMHWNEWIELDNQYLRYHADKRKRIEEYGDKCCRTDGSARTFDAAVELLEELTTYLSERYPSVFVRTAAGVDNIATGECFDVNKLTMSGSKENPMQLCARLVQDDLDILFEGEDGQYYLRASGDFLSGVERLEERMGMSLSELHTSSNVPGFASKLEKGMMSFFRRLKPENPIVRHNYFIQVDENLAHSIYGNDTSPAIGWDMVKKGKAIEHHYFRCERQSLRRLPRSGAVVFTIRTYVHPIVEIAEEPGVAGRLASAIRSWDEDVARYKGREKYQEVLLEYLDRKHDEQVAVGSDTHDEGTSKYPW